MYSNTINMNLSIKHHHHNHRWEPRQHTILLCYSHCLMVSVVNLHDNWRDRAVAAAIGVVSCLTLFHWVHAGFKLRTIYFPCFFIRIFSHDRPENDHDFYSCIKAFTCSTQNITTMFLNGHLVYSSLTDDSVIDNIPCMKTPVFWQNLYQLLFHW